MVRCCARIEHPILFVVGSGSFVTAKLHLLELPGLPTVHFYRAYKSNMHAHSTVIASALVAQKDANACGRPLWILAAAIEANLQVTYSDAYLVVGELHKLLQTGVALLVGYVFLHNESNGVFLGQNL